MKIWITSVFVDDQEKALQFYTEKLGFVKKEDIPLGEHRWLTVVSSDQPDGVELLLEPSSHGAVPPFKQALKTDGITAASFEVDDIQETFERLKLKGVEFTQEPLSMGEMTIAALDDTCGNLIQLIQRG